MKTEILINELPFETFCSLATREELILELKVTKHQNKELIDKLDEYESLLAPVNPDDRKNFIMTAVMGITMSNERLSSIAEDYAEFCLERDRKSMRILDFNAYNKLKQSK